MKLLILGGTRFLGRHVAEQALSRGHDVTLLHRGRSGAALFPQARHLIADRDDQSSLSLLDGQGWDTVIDTSAYVPRQVRAVAARLAGRAAHYQLVSSISVYADFARPGLDESASTAVLDDPLTEVIDGKTYGGLKRLCEEAALAAFGDAALIVRPGLIVGPHDPTGRFTWWVQRLQRGGEVLAPGAAGAPVQFIDARDLAAWMLDAAQARHRGVYNATGPDVPMTMGALLESMRGALAPPGTRLRWADEAWLLEQGVAPWSDLPLWLPRASHGMLQVSVAAARGLGLICRPLEPTLRDTAAWAASLAPALSVSGLTTTTEGPPRPLVGLPFERESALLALLPNSLH